MDVEAMAILRKKCTWDHLKALKVMKDLLIAKRRMYLKLGLMDQG